MLPHDFPPKSMVYEYYRTWQRSGLWKQIHDTLRVRVRRQAGRSDQATASIIDSQSVKTTETADRTGNGERG